MLVELVVEYKCGCYEMKKILLILLLFLCVGCEKNKDVNQFKKEYESYNSSYLKLNISDKNVFQYRSVSDVNQLISEGTCVIYIGSPQDNLSRKVVEILLDASSNTDLKTIYYLDTFEGVHLDMVSDKNIPIVLFVVAGKVEKYMVGTIDGKVDLSDDEVITLYNQYLEGIHLVLQDSCNEECQE